MALQDCKIHLENELEGRNPQDASSIRLRAAIGLVASIIEEESEDKSPPAPEPEPEPDPQLDLPFMDGDGDEE